MNPEVLQTTELLGSLIQGKVLNEGQLEVAQEALGKCLDIISEQVDNLHRVMTN